MSSALHMKRPLSATVKLVVLMAGIAGNQGLSACRQDANVAGDAAVSAVDSNVATDARMGRACNAFDQRMSAPEVFVGPNGYTAQFKTLIDGAQRSIKVQMYIFTVRELMDALVAAKQRGVNVQVMLDPDHMGNGNARKEFEAAGVQLKDAPAVFEYAHAKYMVIDGIVAAISSGNFNYGATTSERNYGLLTRDADDVGDLTALFDADWTRTTPTLNCTRLLLSPVNSRTRLVAHIDSAMSNLDLELMYLLDTDIRSAVSRARARGAKVRVILGSDQDAVQNAAAINSLRDDQIPVRVAKTFDMHAKLIIADGVAFVGSENMSYTSLSKNREVGALVFEPTQASVIQAQFDRDWLSEPLAP
jgi:cardiolipin synthase A/B